MIKIEDIYERTNAGLEIIFYYYPQARGCENTNKKFKIRENESDASACIKMYHGVYRMTDFGNSNKSMTPIDICMEEENVDFSGAMKILCERYNLIDSKGFSPNGPIIEVTPAGADEQTGYFEFEYKDKFSPNEIKLFAPHAKEEHLTALHWHSVKVFTTITNNRKKIVKKSTDTYPIFVRECVYKDKEGTERSFYKIYEPKAEKQYRFQCRGEKPKEYVHGLHELELAFKKYNDAEESKFRQDPMNEGEQFKEKKLPEAVIASGERDAVCIRAFGSNPIWFNSETEDINPAIIRKIKKYVDEIYLIPDIDETGIRKGREKALQFLDLKVIWLPKSLMQHRDHRGNPCKDFRDYCEYHHKQSDFNQLFNIAVQTQFWVESYNEKRKKKSFEIDSVCLHNFLWCNGYYALRDENSDNVQLIKITGNVVESVKPKDILLFIRSWAKSNFLPNEIRNLILNSTKVNESAMTQLEEIQLDFTSYTKESQDLFFDGVTWHITKDGIKELKPAESSSMVWEHNVIKHKVKVIEPCFTTFINFPEGRNPEMDIAISKNNKSNMLNYLINTSRTHWRKELEYYWYDKSPEEQREYVEKHKFDIQGELLSDEEIAEQKLNLLNKIYAIGYNLHRYKSPSRAWAIYAMDNKIGENGECNGRSGKSFLFKSFAHFMNTVTLSGRNPKLMDNPHVFDRVNQHTDFLLVDDCDCRLDIGLFYDSITGGVTVNPKNNKSFFIPFEESPKFGFTTNYVPRDFDASTEARLLYLVFSDYYHEKSEGSDYLENRSIFSDFNRNLFTPDYPEECWNADFNFFAQCLQFYLQVVEHGVKIQPVMTNILRRKLKVDMTEDFEDWANVYFAKDSGNLDILIPREDVYEAFINEAKVNKTFWKMQRFTKALKAYCAYNYQLIEALDPVELMNNSGRIIRKIGGKTKELCYIKTHGTPLSQEIKTATGAMPY